MATTDFTIQDVLTWARTKPADERYPYYDCRHCALAQFSEHIGLPVFNSCRSEMEEYRNLGRHLVAEPQTFGALVSRLEALAPAALVTKSDWARLDAYMADIELASA